MLEQLLAADVAKLAIHRGDKGKCAVARMSATYSNCGFMAFPLISAMLGEIGVFTAVHLSVCSIYPSGRRDMRFCWDCCHALCILSVRCEQRAHDRISGYGLGLRLTYYFHDKHFICFYDPNACAYDQFNLTVIDKMLAGMYTVCIDELRQVKQHGTEKLKKRSIFDG